MTHRRRLMSGGSTIPLSLSRVTQPRRIQLSPQAHAEQAVSAVQTGVVSPAVPIAHPVAQRVELRFGEDLDPDVVADPAAVEAGLVEVAPAGVVRRLIGRDAPDGDADLVRRRLAGARLGAQVELDGGAQLDRIAVAVDGHPTVDAQHPAAATGLLGPQPQTAHDAAAEERPETQ